MQMQADSGGRSRTQPIITLGARREWVVNVMPRPIYLRERQPVSTAHESGWVFGAGLDE